MTTSLVTADSLLAVDIGTVTTRALLFDVIGGSYRFIAEGTAATTTSSPFLDAGEGVQRAIDRLTDITGRTFVGGDGSLITPSRSDGSGVDAFVLTLSAGPLLKVLVVGLLENVSVDSARHLAETTYARVVETLSANDRRQPQERIDVILETRPDLIIMAGGIEGGATLSVRKMLETVGLAGYLLTKDQVPHVLYVGNQALKEEVREAVETVVDLHIAPNIRPTLETEQLMPAQAELSEIYKRIRAKQIHSIPELDAWANGRITPTAVAHDRVVRFLSKVYDPTKGVLGIDLGASAATVSASFNGQSCQGVYPQLGLGAHLPDILRMTRLDQIARWVSIDVPAESVRDYIYNKAAFPASLPATAEDLAIEQAIARQIMRLAIQSISTRFPTDVASCGPKLLPWFEPIIATGSVLTQAPKMSQSLVMILDGLQPTGITTVLLDRNNLIPAVGMAAETNPVLTVQVLGSKAMLSLGTVIAPIGNARLGTPILRTQMQYEDGREVKQEVKFGSIERLPLPLGETATLRLQPLHRFDAGMGPGRGGRLQVVGGAFGVVIDARGRPLVLPSDPGRRRESLQKWLRTLRK